MQQDWKAIWDNLNPDEAAKERMKQAILQKMQAENAANSIQKTTVLLTAMFVWNICPCRCTVLYDRYGCVGRAAPH